MHIGDDILAAETVAHEIGHNLNMRHDFTINQSNQRISKYLKILILYSSIHVRIFVQDYVQLMILLAQMLGVLWTMEAQKQSGVVALDMISKLCSTCTTMPMLGVWKEFKMQEITQVSQEYSKLKLDFYEFRFHQWIVNGQVGHHGQYA